MTDLAGLITTILGFGTAISKDRLQRSELVIKLLKNLGLDPDHPPADFTAVYQYALVEYGVGKPKPVLDIFRQVEIQQIFRRALDQNNPAILLKKGEAFLAEHRLGDELQALGLNAQRELYGFAAVFLEIAKRTRTPAEVLTNQRLDSLHRQLGTMQERLNRLPTLEGIRTEMARLAEQGVPAASESSAAQQCRAFALAQQMRGWFETLGYRFEPTEVWADDYFEWILNIPVRRNRFDRILVRGIAGEAGLRDVLALGNSVAAQRTDEGWLVTARRISRAARDAVEQAENRHLDCYTFDELVDLDADFSGYIAWLEAEILRRGVATQYVPLACAKEELDPVTKQRVTVSRYDERDGWIDGYCDRWLDDSTKEHISVLGEFGTGKTWFAFHYAGVALQRYQEAKERGTQRPRLPLVITLRDYAKALNVENVLAGFFFTQHNIRLNSEVFDQLNRMGKLLLIFDGFDEMAAKVDRQQMINNFWELAKVVVPGAKVILTCRTEHFPEAQDGRALLNAELQASTANLTGETPQFEVLELEKFTDEQIRRVLAFQATAATVEQVMGNPQLLDLARRPVMTELILEALPDIEAGKPVDMSRVYLYAVRRKMERDIKAERTFTSLADKLYFMCELSWEMLSTDQMSLNYREFPDRIRKLFGAMVQEEKDLDHWHYDMMGQTMLIRNADGDYTPAHRSLLEFFVAYKFAAELGALAPDFLELAQMRSDVDSSLLAREYTWSEYFGDRTQVAPLLGFVSESLERLRSGLGQAPLSKVVIDLIIPLLNSNSEGYKAIRSTFTVPHVLISTIESTRNRSIEEAQYVGGNAITLLAKIDSTALEHKDLSHTVIKSADLTQVNLRQTNLSGAILQDSRFAEVCSQIFSLLLDVSGDSIITGGGQSGNGEIYWWNISSRQRFLSFKGHSNAVRALAFRSKDWLLASGSHDHTIKLWNIKGECIRTLEKHQNSVRALAFSPDGRTLISGGEDKTIYIWDVETGESIELTDQGCYVRALAFSPDGRLFASTGVGCTIKIWNLANAQCIKTLERHHNWVKSIAFSPDGLTLVSGSQDYTVKIWDIASGRCMNTLIGHTHQVHCVTFSPDGNFFASGSEDMTIRVWNSSNGSMHRILRGHNNSAQAIAFSSDSKKLASGSQDHSAKLWDISTGEILATFQGHADWIQSISFSPDGNIIASGGQDRVVRLWSSITGQILHQMHGHHAWIMDIAFHPNGNMLASCSLDGTIRLWNVQKPQEKSLILYGHLAAVRTIAFNFDGSIIASGGEDSTIRLWNVATGDCIRQLSGHTGFVDFVTFYADGKTLASSSADHTVRFWNIETGAYREDFIEFPDWNKEITFCPKQELFATSGGDYSIAFWQPTFGKYSIFGSHNGQVKALSFSSDGLTLASAGDDLIIKIWNLDTASAKSTIQMHTRTISALVFSPDGKTIASCSEDGTIRLWNSETGAFKMMLQNTRPYEGMNITGVKGLTEAEKATLKALGAVEDSSSMND